MDLIVLQLEHHRVEIRSGRVRIREDYVGGDAVDLDISEMMYVMNEINSKILLKAYRAQRERRKGEWI